MGEQNRCEFFEVALVEASGCPVIDGFQEAPELRGVLFTMQVGPNELSMCRCG